MIARNWSYIEVACDPYELDQWSKTPDFQYHQPRYTQYAIQCDLLFGITQCHAYFTEHLIFHQQML